MNKRQREIIRKKRLQRLRRKKRNAMICKVLSRIAVVILLMFVLVMFVTFFIKKDELHGTWDCDGVTVYQFDGKGKGALIVPDSTYTFNYEINEDKVRIDFADESALDYTYRFYVDKEELVLSGSEGKETFSYEFTRIEE